VKFLALMFAACAGPLAAATLEGFTTLPADTLMPGPDSGQFISQLPNATAAFKGQVVQGFSAIIPDGNGSYLVLSDNGFGGRENSADFLLRIYCIDPNFRTALGGSGQISINGFVNLSDPRKQIDFAVLADQSHYGLLDPPREVEERIREQRLLTGSDLDPESLQRSADGSLWVGDEFGPFLLHLNEEGEILEPPFGLTGLHAEGYPGNCCGEATLARSQGFEGMAASPLGNFLYPMLEGSVLTQAGQLNIYTFDLSSKSFVNASALEPSYRYQLSPQATAIGAFKLFSETAGLIIERDSGEGADAKYKKIYRIDFDRIDEDGFLLKTEVADLMAILDPDDLNGDGLTSFTFPFETPESLLVVDKDTIGVVSDNNYPFGRARGEGTQPENTEFILITIEDLW